MEKLDKGLSEIDKSRYVQAQAPVGMPSFLDVMHAGRVYKYELLIANLWERNDSRQRPTLQHAHPVFHIVLYVAGQGYVRIGDQLQRVQRGTLVLIPPDTAHAFVPSGGRVAYHALTFRFMDAGASLQMGFNDLLAYYSGKPVCLLLHTQLDLAACGLLQQRIETLGRALQDQPVDWLYHQQQMIPFVAMLSGIGHMPLVAPSLVSRAQALLETRFADATLTLASLAVALHTSPENLCRQFRKQTGVPPMQYRNRLRAQAAGALLRSTNLPCKAIADRLGYSDLYTFSKAYRRLMGHPPVQERQG